MIDKDGYEWGEREDNIGEVILFTNRNVMVFNDEYIQIPFYQNAISCYKVDKTIAQEIADKSKKFYISSWTEWSKEITKKEFEYLLGLRTRQQDLEEGGYGK
jgi:hypothetical protein